MSSSPLITVLMSVYNAEQYIAQAVESILAQTFTDFELLVMDDGSTDRSLSVLKTLAARDGRIRLRHGEHQGIPQAKNRLLKEAKGEFIAIMDADDIALSERFARQVDFLQKNTHVVCVGGAHELIDQKGYLLGCFILPESDAEIQKSLLGGIALIHHPCTMIRRSALLAIGGYDETMVCSEDLDLWLRLGEIGELANLKDVVLQYRLHPKSSTYREQEQQKIEAMRACERAWLRRGIRGEFMRGYTDRLNQHEFLLQCGWTGFAANQWGMAIHYGLRAILARPASRSSWKLLLLALLLPLKRAVSR